MAAIIYFTYDAYFTGKSSQRGRFIINRRSLSNEHLHRFRSLEAIFDIPRDEACRVFSPYFVRYHSRLYREKGYLACILDFARWWSDLLEVEGKDVLDIGCGFGIYTLFFTFFKARHVYGADHNQEKHDLFLKVLSLVEPPIENVQVSLQDGLGLRFEDGQFPAIFIKDVISHVRALDPFLSEVSRLLSPGGRLFITDENNSLDLVVGKKGRRRIWFTEEGIESRAGEDNGGGMLPQTYREMRREDIAIQLRDRELALLPGIRKLFPDYREEERDRARVLDLLSQLTQGLWGDELIEGTNQILETGALKIKPVFPYRHPRTGDFSEREFNPFRVAKALERHGIKAQVIRPFYSTQKPLLNMIGKVIRATHPLSILIQSSYYILGTKELPSSGRNRG